MGIKLVWAYATVVLLGGLGMVFYAKWQDEGGWAGFLPWLVAMAGVIVFGMRRGLKKRRAIEAEELGVGR